MDAPIKKSENKPAKKSGDGVDPHHAQTSSKPKMRYTIDEESEDDKEAAAPAPTPPRPEAGASSSLPHIPEASRAYHPSLSAEAAQTCVRCVKMLKSDPNHYCHRANQYHKCEHCVKSNKSCISIPRALQPTLVRLLKHRANADFGQQADMVIEEMEAYVYGRRGEGEGQGETVHLLRSINRNLFRIVNILQVAGGGEEFGEEEEEVEIDVFGAVM